MITAIALGLIAAATAAGGLILGTFVAAIIWAARHHR